MPVLATKVGGDEVTWMDFRGTGVVLGGFASTGVLCLLVQSQVPLPVASLLAFAAAAAGIVLGFLMGTPPAAEGDGTAARSSGSTHLEQISDWLTKILVGAGLVQLGEIPRVLQSMVDAIERKDGLKLAAIACILIGFFILGFFIGYLATRLFLAGAFVRADRAGQVPDRPVGIAVAAGAGAEAAAGAEAGAQTLALIGAEAGATTRPLTGGGAAAEFNERPEKLASAQARSRSVSMAGRVVLLLSTILAGQRLVASLKKK